MIGIIPILARWRVGLGLFGIIAALGLIAATQHYRKAYLNEKKLRQSDHALYIQAQHTAAELAKRAITEKEAEYNLKAMETDLAYRTQLADARSATARYIAANRVPNRTVESGTSKATSSPEGSSAQGTDGSSSNPFMVAVTEGDILICTDNTKRLEAARVWALGLEKSQ